MTQRGLVLLRRCLVILPLACVASGAALLSSCSSVQRNPLADEWRPSPNFGPRLVSLVVLHHTDIANSETALRTLRDPAQAVSAHYLISRAGRVTQLVEEQERAWHAGHSRWGAITDVNSASIGIELDNNGKEPFPASQIASLLKVLEDLRTRHKLTPLAYVAHADVAPGRKVDPSVLFPWRDLAQKGFGLWCDAPLPTAPANFDVVLGLQTLGYDVTLPDAAADAFVLHYQQPQAVDSKGGGVDSVDMAMLACIVQRAREVTTP